MKLRTAVSFFNYLVVNWIYYNNNNNNNDDDDDDDNNNSVHCEL